jgi:hypothetical protein
MERLLNPASTSLPDSDPVSSNAAIQTWKMIDEAKAYLLAWRGSLLGARAALDTQLAAYEAVERQNEGRA